MQKIIFNDGIFSIDDDHYLIYVESQDYKELSTLFQKEIIEKYFDLIVREELTFNEAAVRDFMKSEIYMADNSNP